MKSKFTVDYGTGTDRHTVTFEHLYEALDFISMKLCQDVPVSITPEWRCCK